MNYISLGENGGWSFRNPLLNNATGNGRTRDYEITFIPAEDNEYGENIYMLTPRTTQDATSQTSSNISGGTSKGTNDIPQ